MSDWDGGGHGWHDCAAVKAKLVQAEADLAQAQQERDKWKADALSYLGGAANDLAKLKTRLAACREALKASKELRSSLDFVCEMWLDHFEDLARKKLVLGQTREDFEGTIFFARQAIAAYDAALKEAGDG